MYFPPIYVTSPRTSVAPVVTTLTSSKTRESAVWPNTESYKPMPIPTASSCYMESTELSSSSQLEAEQRALQLALEYSMLGLTSEEDATSTFDELRVKKSVNMTECVAVPSSEHVAEIVGRQGCKIKALRAKTNTYIKTPVRGEDPVFVITGRKEDVAVAKQEILSAANHFSQIRAQRKNSALNSGPSSPTGGPGQTTIQVRVPYRVVGLVVGPKGATIKRIQQATNTYIVTPSRDKEPIFEVTGSLENVESARKEIETHIVLRTGGLLDDDVFQGNGDALNSFNGFQGGHIYTNGRNGVNGRDLHRALSTDSFYLNSSKIADYNALASPFSTSSNGTSNGYFFNHDLIPSPTDDLIIPNTGFNSSPPPPSPSIWGTDTKSDTTSFSASNGGLNGVGSIGSGRPITPHTNARRLASEPLLPGITPSTTLGSFSRFTTSTTAPIGTISNSGGSLTTTTSVNGEIPRVNGSGGVIGSRSPTNVDTTNNNTISNLASKKKDCVICHSAEVVAALVPCGHNFFCMECATKLKTDDSSCPVCQQQVTQILRIIS